MLIHERGLAPRINRLCDAERSHRNQLQRGDQIARRLRPANEFAAVNSRRTAPTMFLVDWRRIVG